MGAETVAWSYSSAALIASSHAAVEAQAGRCNEGQRGARRREAAIVCFVLASWRSIGDAMLTRPPHALSRPFDPRSSKSAEENRVPLSPSQLLYHPQRRLTLPPSQEPPASDVLQRFSEAFKLANDNAQLGRSRPEVKGKGFCGFGGSQGARKRPRMSSDNVCRQHRVSMERVSRPGRGDTTLLSA